MSEKAGNPRMTVDDIYEWEYSQAEYYDSSETKAGRTVAESADAIYDTIHSCNEVAGILHEAIYGPRPEYPTEKALCVEGITGRMLSIQDKADRLYSVLIDIKRGLK